MSLAPRILSLSGTVFPKALVQSIDLVTGVVVYAWLDADEQAVDSGGSIARCIPVTENIDGIEVPSDPGDAAIVSAIENPLPPPAAVIARSPLDIRTRMTLGELLALDTSAIPAVIITRNNFIAAQEVRSDDPRTAAGKTILIDNGILTQERADEIFA